VPVHLHKHLLDGILHDILAMDQTNSGGLRAVEEGGSMDLSNRRDLRGRGHGFLHAGLVASSRHVFHGHHNHIHTFNVDDPSAFTRLEHSCKREARMNGPLLDC